MTWRDQALCADHPNPALWFADNAREMRAAVVICRSCRCRSSVWTGRCLQANTKAYGAG